ncbi:MAG: SlyX family protein [Thiotrichaceae bacterium]
MPAKRIEELEILITQHEDSIESLSSTMHRQQLHIEKLDKSIELLMQRLKNMQDSTVKPLEDETPPPHY